MCIRDRAHRDVKGACNIISDSIEKSLESLKDKDIEEILKQRYQKIMSYGLV